MVKGSALEVDRWRIIQDGPCCGAENMAVDEAILRAVCSSAAPPTVRLYEWKVPTISIGYRQRAEPFEGWDGSMVRRITGGRAMLHHMELTYCVVCGPENRLFKSGIQGAYSAISRCIVKALGDLGVKASFSTGRRCPQRSEACFHSATRYEVLVDGRKLVGSAQRRFKGGFLQHGSILFDVDETLTRSLFGEQVLDRMNWVRACAHIDKEEFKRVLIKRLEEGLKASFDKGLLTTGEAGFKEALIIKRYGTNEWNLKRSTLPDTSRALSERAYVPL
jgi:lipoate-protein ligase A